MLVKFIQTAVENRLLDSRVGIFEMIFPNLRNIAPHGVLSLVNAK